MTLVFVSNFMNIHQVPLCEAFYKILGEDFTFIETTPIAMDRVEMGFSKCSYSSYVKSMMADDVTKKKCMDAIINSDIVIMGSAPDYVFSARLKTRKLTFKYSERYFKGNNSFYERIRYRISSYRHIRPLKKKNVYFLCASAFTAQDINRFGKFPRQSYKWGYFREVVQVNPEQIIFGKKPNSILWVGRMIDWKHPELAVELAAMLKKAGVLFSLTMVGNGEMKTEIEKLIVEKNLQDCVEVTGAKTPNEVKQYMDRSEIFIATSDYKEGWGVVINEAMNSCCAIVASHAMGSVPFLIKDGQNGLVFENGDKKVLYQKVKQLIQDDEFRKQIQNNAIKTLIELWNADIAVERFFEIVQDIVEERTCSTYIEGPCSIAEIIPNDWYPEK